MRDNKCMPFPVLPFPAASIIWVFTFFLILRVLISLYGLVMSIPETCGLGHHYQNSFMSARENCRF